MNLVMFTEEFDAPSVNVYMQGMRFAWEFLSKNFLPFWGHANPRIILARIVKKMDRKLMTREHEYSEYSPLSLRFSFISYFFKVTIIHPTSFLRSLISRRLYTRE